MYKLLSLAKYLAIRYKDHDQNFAGASKSRYKEVIRNRKYLDTLP